jgi:hypothetical protein
MYINTGDFVESCTAIVEHQDGTLELIRWATQEIKDDLPTIDASASETI